MKRIFRTEWNERANVKAYIVYSAPKLGIAPWAWLCVSHTFCHFCLSLLLFFSILSLSSSVFAWIDSVLLLSLLSPLLMIFAVVLRCYCYFYSSQTCKNVIWMEKKNKQWRFYTTRFSFSFVCFLVCFSSLSVGSRCKMNVCCALCTISQCRK